MSITQGLTRHVDLPYRALDHGRIDLYRGFLHLWASNNSRSSYFWSHFFYTLSAQNNPRWWLFHTLPLKEIRSQQSMASLNFIFNHWFVQRAGTSYLSEPGSHSVKIFSTRFVLIHDFHSITRKWLEKTRNVFSSWHNAHNWIMRYIHIPELVFRRKWLCVFWVFVALSSFALVGIPKSIWVATIWL